MFYQQNESSNIPPHKPETIIIIIDSFSITNVNFTCVYEHVFVLEIYLITIYANLYRKEVYTKSTHGRTVA